MDLTEIPGKEAATNAEINCDIARILAYKKGFNPRNILTTTQFSQTEMGPQTPPYFYDIGLQISGPNLAELASYLSQSARNVACHTELDVQYESVGNTAFKISSKVAESHELSLQLLKDILKTDFHPRQIMVEDRVLREKTYHSEINLGLLKVALEQNDIDPGVIKTSSVPEQQAPWYTPGIVVDTQHPDGAKAISFFDKAFAEMDKGWEILVGMKKGPTPEGYGFFTPAFQKHEMTQAALAEILKPMLKRYPVRSTNEFQTTGTSCKPSA